MVFDQWRPFIYCNSRANHWDTIELSRPQQLTRKQKVIAAGVTSDRICLWKFYETVSWAGPFVEQMCLHPIYDWIPISEASSTLSTWIRYSEYVNLNFSPGYLSTQKLTSASCARLFKKTCQMSKNRYPMESQNVMNQTKFLCCMAITEVNIMVHKKMPTLPDRYILWYEILFSLLQNTSHEILMKSRFLLILHAICSDPKAI